MLNKIINFNFKNLKQNINFFNKLIYLQWIISNQLKDIQ